MLTHTIKSFGPAVIASSLLMNWSSSAWAQATAPEDHAGEASKGIVPVPPYGGDFWSRAYLTGDWGGQRTDLANHGVQLNIDWTQAFQGVVDGGRDEDSEYGGALDYELTLDLMRMGVMDGAIVKMRAETRYGETVNGDSGAILPVNTDGFFPVTDSLDEDIPFTITSLNYTQFLSPKFGVLIGKIDTLDGDPNEFASGRGKTQFMNANFVFNPALALRFPYSTLAVGAVWMPVQEKDAGVTISGMLMNTVDSSTTTGFSDIGDGASLAVEADFQYRLGDLPGGMNVGFLYSFDQEFAQISSRLIFQRGEGLSFPATDDSWAGYWSGWQYLCVEEDVDAPISLGNGMPDRQGVGLFARAGFADQDTNPVEWAISGGVGGRGIIPSRDNDIFGLGYYYASIQQSRLTGFLGLDDHVQGFEAFYNLAITPAAQLTFDVQAVESIVDEIDAAIILGMRLGLRF